MADEERSTDPIIAQLGDLGPYQLRYCLLIFLSKFGTGWHTLAHIFLAGKQEITCSTPNVTDYCSSECPGYVYNTSIFETTIVSEWDLVCGRKKYSSMSQSIVMAGIMFGSIVFGMWADRSGRRPAFLTACGLQLITGLIACISPWFWFYCLFRFLVAFATGAIMATSFVLIMEIIGPKKREAIGVLYQIPFNLGHATLAVFGWFIRTWRLYQFAVTIFSVVFILYYWLIPESPRWLFTTGRLDQAIPILEKAAEANGLATDHIAGEIEYAYVQMAAKTPMKKATVVDLFRYPYLRLKTIVMAYDWLVCCMVYYGVAQYISTLGGNVFLNVAIGAFLGVPGTCICVPLTKFIGRKYTLMLSNMISAVALLLMAIKPDMGRIFQIGCATLGLFGASITFPNVYLYGGELFPTVARAAGVGLCSFVGRVGSILAPHICDLKVHSLRYPPGIFGIVSLIAAVGVIVLPETKGHVLPETLEDGENFGKHRKSQM